MTPGPAIKVTDVIQGSGPNIRAILAMARRAKGWKLEDSREYRRSGGEDGLYRVTLINGAVVECTVQHHSKATLHL